MSAEPRPKAKRPRPIKAEPRIVVTRVVSDDRTDAAVALLVAWLCDPPR